MQILQVIPIAKSVTTEVLSYFSLKEVALGQLVTVPLRNKNIKAIVVASESVVNMKSQLRGAHYQIRNIHEVHAGSIFSPEFLRACNTTKNFYATTTGKVIEKIAPAVVLQHIEEWEHPQRERKHAKGFRQLLLQQQYTDRMTYYKTMVREHLLKKESLHIVCPTIECVIRIFDVLKKNNTHVYFLHSDMTKKQTREVYQTIFDLNKPSVLVSTPGFIDVHQEEKNTIIIEEESSEYYRTVTNPYLDLRFFVTTYAREANINLMWADSVLRPETYALSLENKAETIEPFNTRIFKNGDIVIINQHVSQQKKQSDEERIKELTEKEKGFSTLSLETIKILKKSILKKEKVFLFVHRKGLAPSIVCNDCGNIARSPESGLPYTLYTKTNSTTKKKERIFVCTMSGETIPAFDSCQFCRGYNLTQLGIGTERVYEEVHALFPKTKTYIIDSEHVKTKKGMREVVSDYTKRKSSVIIIGTQKAIPQLPFIDTTVIVSLDSYFSRMSYTTHTDVLRLVNVLKEKSKQPLILQSRNITESSLPILTNGVYTGYVKKELDERKTFGYPPYTTLCVIKRIVPKYNIQKEYRLLNTAFDRFHPNIMTHPALKKTMVTLVLVLQLNHDTWSIDHQDPKLDALLRGFDRTTEIIFNPHHLL
ncbi:hypothetical protein KC901_02820 [Patescibacteria group bacterium]|nr:hypothetical protein [Patescibacteria group bacterium]